MTTPVSDLRPSVLAHAHNAPGATVDRALIEAAREFCGQCNAWRADVEFNTVAGQPGCTITPPTGGVLCDILTVRLSGVGTLTKCTVDQLDTEFTDGRESQGAPDFYYRGGRNEIVFAPVPADVKYGKLRGAFKPALNATVFDDRLVDDYSQVIINGAIAKVLAIPGKPWSNVGLAEYHERLFYSAFPEAKTHAAAEGTKSLARVVVYGGL